MKAILFVVCALALVSASTSEWTLDEGVLVLTTANFEKAISDSQYTLVEFYAPWCGHCQSLAPEYAAAAQHFAEANPDVKLAKVDATENQELADKFDVQGFPTLKFFKRGDEQPTDYTGGRTKDTIISWLNRRTGSASLEVKSVEEVQKQTQEAETVAIYFGSSESANFQHFTAAANSFDEVVFVHTSSSEVREKYGGQEDNIVVTNGAGAETHVHDKPASEEAFKAFIGEHEFPAVSQFNAASIGRIFKAGNDGIILLKAKNEAGEKAEADFRAAAKELKDKIIFTVANFDEDLGSRVAEFLGIEESELPTFRVVRPREDMKKFKPEGELNEEGLKKFINDVLSGVAKPFLKASPPPAEPYEGGVRVVVSSTWEEIVMDNTKDVLLELYAPWCGHCKNLAPVYESLAGNLKSHENVVVAKMDATANEIEGLQIEGFPTIRLYKKDDKQNPIEFDRNREEKDFIRFLKKHEIIPKDGTEEPSDDNNEFNMGDLHGQDHGDHGDHDHDHDHGHDDHAHDDQHKVDTDL